MMNKKLAILLFAIATVSTTMFGDGFFGDLGRGVGRVTESAVEAPADFVSGGKTWEERHDRWADQDADRRAREENRYQERRAREEERRSYYNDRY